MQTRILMWNYRGYKSSYIWRKKCILHLKYTKQNQELAFLCDRK